METFEIYENETAPSETYTNLQRDDPTDIYEKMPAKRDEKPLKYKHDNSEALNDTLKSIRKYLISLFIVLCVVLVTVAVFTGLVYMQTNTNGKGMETLELDSIKSMAYLEQNFRSLIEEMNILLNNTDIELEKRISRLEDSLDNKELVKDVQDLKNMMEMDLNKNMAFLEQDFRSLSEETNILLNNTGLFDFSTHTFTPCGKTGREGPSLNMCKESYRRQQWANSEFFGMQINGVQQWRVPITAFYRINAAGAKGGSGHNGTFSGGEGANLEATFLLTKNTTLNIVCGQQGSAGMKSEPGGGGGGTFVYIGGIGENGLLVAAGGGGGGGEENTRNGYHDTTSVDGSSSVSSYNYCESRTGYGGAAGIYTISGAGWKSDGLGLPRVNGNPGKRWIGGNIAANAAQGGFGGGGSGCNSNGGGGGGGYTGGNGISDSDISTWGGSGAGSFISGIDQLYNTRNNADGYVRIDKS